MTQGENSISRPIRDYAIFTLKEKYYYAYLPVIILFKPQFYQCCVMPFGLYRRQSHISFATWPGYMGTESQPPSQSPGRGQLQGQLLIS